MTKPKRACENDVNPPTVMQELILRAFQVQAQKTIQGTHQYNAEMPEISATRQENVVVLSTSDYASSSISSAASADGDCCFTSCMLIAKSTPINIASLSKNWITQSTSSPTFSPL